MECTHYTFPGNVRYTLPAVKCIYSHQSITKFTLSRNYMAQISSFRRLMQKTKENTLIRTLIPKTIHFLINHFVCVCVCVCVCTGCPSRNVPDFGRVFLMLNYTDITQNTYIQS